MPCEGEIDEGELTPEPRDDRFSLLRTQRMSNANKDDDNALPRNIVVYASTRRLPVCHRRMVQSERVLPEALSVDRDQGTREKRPGITASCPFHEQWNNFVDVDGRMDEI